MLAAADPGNPQEPGTGPLYTDLLPHVLSSGAVRDVDPAVRALVINQIVALYIRGEFHTCLSLAAEALEAWAELGDLEHDLFVVRRHQANTLRSLGRLTEALRADRELYEHGREHLGLRDPDTLRATSGLAASCRRVGDFEAARKLDADALAAYTEVYGPDGEETLRTSHNVGVNLRLEGRFREALALDLQNARRYDETLGPNHLFTLFSWNNVARDQRECGEYYESLALEENIVARYRELFGEEGPATLRAIKNLAVSRRKAGRYQEAFELAEQVLARHVRLLGERNPETLAATTNLANDYRCLGRTPPPGASPRRPSRGTARRWRWPTRSPPAPRSTSPCSCGAAGRPTRPGGE